MSSIDATPYSARDPKQSVSGATRLRGNAMLRLLIGVQSSEVGKHDVVRIVGGMVLLTAAGLKAFQLLTGPILETGLLDSRWFLICIVEFELLFGLWLLSGLVPAWSDLAAVGCFSCFACVSVYKALSGAETCGCFGNWRVNPWFTATLDLAIVFFLLRSRPSALSRSRFPTSAVSNLAAVLGGWLLIGGIVLSITWRGPTRSLTDLGEVLADGRIVVLKPDAWLGRRLPLFDYLDTGDTLESGNWLVLLYHHGCPDCQHALKQLSAIAASVGADRSAHRAIVEVPPHTGFPAGYLEEQQILKTRLTDIREWFVETPVVLILRDGFVLNVIERERLSVNRI